MAQAWNVLGAIGTPVLGEHAADRSDPETIPLDGDELADRTGQRRLRGSLSPHEERRCRLEDFGGYLQLGVTALESPDLRSIGRGDPFSVVFVDLLLADLVTQRLGVHPQPLGHRRDRRPLARIFITEIQHQTDSLGPDLRVVLTRHGMHLPEKQGVHQSRDGSDSGG